MWLEAQSNKLLSPIKGILKVFAEGIAGDIRVHVMMIAASTVIIKNTVKTELI